MFSGKTLSSANKQAHLTHSDYRGSHPNSSILLMYVDRLALDGLIAHPSTPDFSAQVDLNLALGLVTSCCGRQTA